MRRFTVLDWICLVLIIVGGINWGLVGLLKFNLVDAIFGYMSIISRIVYVLVGAAAVYSIFLLIKLTKATP